MDFEIIDHPDITDQYDITFSNETYQAGIVDIIYNTDQNDMINSEVYQAKELTKIDSYQTNDKCLTHSEDTEILSDIPITLEKECGKIKSYGGIKENGGHKKELVNTETKMESRSMKSEKESEMYCWQSFCKYVKMIFCCNYL